MFDKLIEKVGKEEIERIVVERLCPRFFGLSMVEDCTTYPQNCASCWAKALGMEDGE